VCSTSRHACGADVGSLAHHLHARQWQRLSQSQGTKGERL